MKLPRFWKLYLISVFSAVCFVVIGLVVFYGFVDSYEKSQPEYAAQYFADTLTEDALAHLVMKEIPEALSSYESTNTVHRYYMETLSALDGSLSVRKDYKNYSSATPVFHIIKDSVAIASISLETAENGAFSMKRWQIETATALPENWAPPQEYTLYTPANATITINGIPVSDENLTDIDIPYAYASSYEPNSSARWNVYTVQGLHAIPTVICTVQNDTCVQEEKGNVFMFRYPDSAADTYTITVPEMAIVSVNGVTLTKKEITAEDISYEYPLIESAVSALPKAVTYTVSGLFDTPKVRAVLSDTELTCTGEGREYTAAYPDSMLYTCTLRVPTGSAVTLHGIDCSSYYVGQETAYSSLAAHASSLPVYDAYTISGLYSSPADAISVSLNGETLPSIVRTDGYTVTCRATISSVENKEIEDCALAFVRDYITYTGQGYNNTDANLYKVLSHVIPYTETYTRIANSRIGIIYVTPVTANEYKKLEVSSIVKYSDDMYECVVEFDVMQKTYNVQNDYAGQIQLLLIKKNGVWKVADMQIDSKQGL